MIREGTADLRALQAFLGRSQALWAAQLTFAGVVLEATGALEDVAGASLVGRPFASLVCEPQRAAFRALLRRCGEDAWESATFAMCPAGDGAADDRAVHLRRHADGVLVVAEPADRRRDQLLQQLLSLNDDLIGTQRTLAERTHALEIARDEAERAAARQRSFERIAAAGLEADEPAGVMRLLLEQACAVVGAPRSTLLLVDDDRDHIVVHDRIGPDADAAVGLRIPYGTGLAGEVVATGRPLVLADARASAEMRRYEGLRVDASLAVVPLRVGGEVTGVLHVGADAAGAFGDEDLLLLEAVADRAAAALAHAHVVQREHRIAETFQRSLLPASLPEVGRLRLQARYRAAASAARVGGDWYDAIAFPDGRVGVVIGDVAGKGLPAAVTMGQVRSAMRALALDAPEPVDVLRRLDPFVADLETMATALYALVDPASGSVTYARAGHLPAIVVRSAGGGVAVRQLDDGLSPPLGLGRTPRVQASASLRPGDALVLYTDGLIERRREDLLDSLTGLARACATRTDGVELADHLLATFAGPSERYADDVAVVTASITRT